MGRVLQRSEARSTAVLAGKYRLIAELGQGGMATVYLAVAIGDSGFRKLAVVKLLRPEFAIDEEFIQMFLDEARLCARLSHPNIVHTYDVGVDEGEHLIAMEYLDGVSLHAATAKLGRNSGPFTFPLQAKVLLEVIEGLRYAHELRDYDGRSLEIVHRDVTPHNIFVTYDGQVKLLDFGIAKAATSSVKTATGVIKGKLTYMAPEQARGEPVDARADLYAVGVMLWEAVTGKRRWPTGITEPALFTRLATGELPESPNAASKGLPAEIDAVVMRALAPKPDDRYQTAGELRDALDAVMRTIEPVSLRTLSAMLSKTFAEDRRHLRDVIEEQFRTLDTGGALSEPHQLPAVPNPNIVTGSHAHLPPAAGSAPDPARNAAPGDTLVESQSRRITEPAPDLRAAPRPPSRSRIAILAAGVLIAMAFVLGVAIPRARSGPAATPAPTLSQAAASSSATEDADARAREEAPASTVTAQPPATSAPADSAGRRATPIAPRWDALRAAASARVPASSPSAAPASSDSSGKEPPPLRSPQTRPKVQLERDNPWP
jgi:serine/threonine-protein kinase